MAHNVVTAQTLKAGGGFVGDSLNVRKPQVFTPRQALRRTALETYGPEGFSDEQYARDIREGITFKSLQKRKLLNLIKLVEFLPRLVLNEVDSFVQIDKWWGDGLNDRLLKDEDDDGEGKPDELPASKPYTWRVPLRLITRVPLSAIVSAIRIFTSPTNTVLRPTVLLFKEHPYIATALLFLTVAGLVTLGLSTAGVGLAPLAPAIPFLVPLLGKGVALLATNILVSLAPLLIPAAVKLWQGFRDEMRIQRGVFAVTSMSQRISNTPAYKGHGRDVYVAVGARQRDILAPLLGPEIVYKCVVRPLAPSSSHSGGSAPYDRHPADQQAAARKAIADRFVDMRPCYTGEDGRPKYLENDARDMRVVNAISLETRGGETQIIVPVPEIRGFGSGMTLGTFMATNQETLLPLLKKTQAFEDGVGRLLLAAAESGKEEEREERRSPSPISRDR